VVVEGGVVVEVVVEAGSWVKMKLSLLCCLCCFRCRRNFFVLFLGEPRLV
jgi:hypothetical protein